MKLAIVVIGYNRVKSIQRLLFSLEKAYYDSEPVPLYISIDNSGCDDVVKLARSFNWSHGKKTVLTYPKRQGLRNHILQCGDIVREFDAIAVLEDDIVVAPGFYHYMKETVYKYKDNTNIAGISLYHYEWNEFASMPFQPAYSSSDVYFIQTAPSLGQIWMKKQWFAFKEWYKTHNEDFIPEDHIPYSVSMWPNTSWKKYHIKYCIENNKYFVFPYKALSTNYPDIGIHCKQRYHFLQVSMLVGDKIGYILPDNFNDSDSICYDGFFERVFVENNIAGIKTSQLCVDLYGSKPNSMGKRFYLTCKILPYKVVRSFGYCVKPQEQNFIENSDGEEMFLYDTAIQAKNKRVDASVEIFRYRFNLNEKTRILMRCIINSWKSYVKDGRIKLLKRK